MVARSVQPRVPAGRRLRAARRVRACGLLLAAVLGSSCDPESAEREASVPRAGAVIMARVEGDAGVRLGPVDSRKAAASTRHVEAVKADPVSAAIVTPRSDMDALEPSVGRADRFELTFVGDVILGRYRDGGYDPIPDGEHEPFAEVTELLRSDLVVGNLETPLVRTLPERSPVGARYSFGADVALARHLVPAGFDALSLANNHAYDLLNTGVEETPEILAELGITPLGAVGEEVDQSVRVETIEREGWRVGLVAVTTQTNAAPLPGMPPLPLVEPGELATRVVPLVEDARVAHDLVVVLVHWGIEYADEPDWQQQQAARALVEAGADLVIGHHPHVLQGIERHGHGLIAYSLGNFLFENVKEIPRQTGVLRVRYDGRGCLQAAVLHPVFVKSVPIKHPVPATGFMARQIRERVRLLSQGWSTRFRDEGEDLVVEGLG